VAVTERDDEIAREQIEETGQNPTREQMGEEGPEPVDVGWDENEPTPHEGEEETEPA
jgi:hypothetical protein